METKFLSMIPVLPSANITRDCQWYEEKTGFKTHYADTMYAILYRDNLCIHLQWHADTADNPLVGWFCYKIECTGY